MKKINKIVLAVALFAGAASLGSCEDFINIDKYVYEKLTLDSVWMSNQRTLEYINGTAAFLPNEGKLYSSAWNDNVEVVFPQLVADEAIMPWYPDGSFQSNFVLTGEVNPRDTRAFNWWPAMYKGIRKTNIILANIHKNKELTDMVRRDYIGRTHFLRAYFYFCLVRMWGPVPILPETAFDTDAPNDEVSFERSSWEDCVEYICAEMEKAATYLPPTREQANQYLPTSGAALAVIARMRLYSASPLYNGNPYYSAWTRSDGTHFIPQDLDNSKWGQAAAAFKRIIDMNMYEIHTEDATSGEDGTLELPSTVSDAPFPDGAGGIDPYKSYKVMFDGSVNPNRIKEYIYYYPRSGAGNDAASDDWVYYPIPQDGITGFSVIWEMIEAYRMADGRPFSEATAEERSWEPVGSPKIFSKDYPLDPLRAKMDDNREPRFYASIGFNHCVWPGTGYTGNDAWRRNIAVNYYWDGNNAPQSVYGADRNRTGYTARKWIHQEDNRRDGKVIAKTYPAFRYAEVLLGYVEAMNEMNQDYTDEVNEITVTRDLSEMVKYFNQIRYRGGLPGITEADAADQTKMRQLIKDERRVEFAFEGHRWHDLRRWKDSYDAINRPVTGLDITAREAQRQRFYTVRVWNTERYMRRVFENKMYFFPIDQSVLDRNGKLVQNPGW